MVKASVLASFILKRPPQYFTLKDDKI